MPRHRPKSTDEPVLPPLAAALVEARGKRGVTQEVIGDDLGVSQVAVSGWERGTKPRVERLADIARVYVLPVGRVRSLWMSGASKAA